MCIILIVFYLFFKLRSKIVQNVRIDVKYCRVKCCISSNICNFIALYPFYIFMNTFIYITIAAILGGCITALIMSLRESRKHTEQLRREDRLVADLQQCREEIERMVTCAEKADANIVKLQSDNNLLSESNTKFRVENDALRQRCEELVNEIQQYREQSNVLQENMAGEVARRVKIEAEYNSLQEKLDTQKSEIEKLHEQTLNSFKLLASNVMEEKTRTFKEMSSESLKTILDPLNRDIENFKKQVNQCYEIENRERTTLQEQIRKLSEQNEKMRSEANRLSSTLRGNTRVQGDWGEMILSNILCQSGLREGEDYEIQKTVDAQGDNSRPDAILHFPNHSDLIIDSKVSYTAYDNYMHAESDEQRKVFARQHLDSVYAHIKELQSKAYSTRNKNAADFVIMFIPIESMFMLAIDEARAMGRNLWNDAYSKQIIIMTPTNLVLAVRMIQDMWRQEHLKNNIQAIKERAEKMFTQFVSFATDIDAVRKNLDDAVRSCDSARSRLVSGKDNLILQFDKMSRLGIERRIVAKKAVQSSWKTLQEEAGVTEEENLNDSMEENLIEE